MSETDEKVTKKAAPEPAAANQGHGPRGDGAASPETDLVALFKRRILYLESTVDELQGHLRRLLANSKGSDVAAAMTERPSKEAILEAFPPDSSRNKLGVGVNRAGKELALKEVDCAERLHLCQAACCRFLDAILTPSEIRSGEFDWDEDNPYALRKQEGSDRCVYLDGQCGCKKYTSRPSACRIYSCAGDRRIWLDFDKRIVNPALASKLAAAERAAAES